jgi:hypothetical protein
MIPADGRSLLRPDDAPRLPKRNPETEHPFLLLNEKLLLLLAATVKVGRQRRYQLLM